MQSMAEPDTIIYECDFCAGLRLLDGLKNGELLDAVQKLSEADVQILGLRVTAGLSYDRNARVLERNQHTVKASCLRFVRRVKTVLCGDKVETLLNRSPVQKATVKMIAWLLSRCIAR